MVPRHDEIVQRPTVPRHASPHSKISLVSPTPSVEADDELSSLDDRSSDPEQHPDHSDGDRMPAYEGEDTRPTSRKELAGWYSYAWAAEIFVIVGVASFMPITLEQLARDQGVLQSDKNTPCQASWKPPPYTSWNASSPHVPKHGHKELPVCVVNVLGFEVNTASFAMYTFSSSVLVQALLIISISAAADHGRFRKKFLLCFAVMGSMATMLFLAPVHYILGAVLAVVANTCFGASFVLLNSFLPLLVRYHPEVQPVERDTSEEDVEDESQQDHEDESTVLLNDSRYRPRFPRSKSAVISPQLKLSTRLSSNGIGIGYLAALLVQIVAIAIVVGTGSTTFSLRLVLFFIGLWWLTFTLPAALWLRPRPGPPLPASLTRDPIGIGYVIYAWTSLFKTIRQARKLKDLLIFLTAWFLLSDSIATVSGTAILFAKTQLGMRTEALAMINVTATVFGVLGAFYWSLFSRLLDLRASQTIIACICIFEVIPLYGLLGYIPAVKRMGYLGLQQPWEMYPVGAIYGFVLGGLSSYCRAFFGELIPPGFEAAFYALYSITDKGSSVFGPAIVGVITQKYGEIRPAFLFLAVLIGLPLPLMMLLDADRGKSDAKAMAEQLEGRRKDHEAGGNYGSIPAIRLPDEDEDDDEEQTL